MSLERLTKIDGGGISTTSDYRVGVITATKFVGPFDGTGANFSGVITASSANFSGNVTIGGTLTYEDVTNIDSVGIITARTGLVSPYADIDDFLDVGSNIKLGNAGIVTATTFKGDGDFVELDVDGHTNLDNVSVAGVSTFTGLIDAEGGITVDDYLELFHYGGTNFIRPNNGSLDIINPGGGPNIARFIPGNGVELWHTASKKFNTTSTGAVVTGILTVSQDLDVDGHTNLDNVSIAGVTSVSSLTSGRVVTAGTAGKLQDSSDLTFDSNSRLSIGGENAGHFYSGADNLVVADFTADTGISIFGGSSNKSYIAMGSSTFGTGALEAFIEKTHGNNNPLTIATQIGNSNIQFKSANDFVFSSYAGPAERVRITSVGDVGVGNNSPDCKLAIKDTAEFAAYDGTTPNSGNILLQLWNNPPNETANDHASMQFAVNGGTHNRVNTISAVAESAGNRKLAFTFCTDDAGTRTEKLRITGDGDVLIADTTNSIYNDTSGGGINLKANGQIVTKKEATSTADPLVWLNDTGQTTNETIVLAQDGTKKASVGLVGNNLAFFVNGTEKLQVNSNGIDASGDIDLDNGGSAGINFRRNGTLKADIEIGSASDEFAIRARGSSGFIKLSTGSSADERLRITSTGVISFDEGTTAAITPSQTTATSIGHQTMSGGTYWFNHSNGTDYFGVDGDWKLTNGATYGKIVARNTENAISNAEQAGHTWFMVCKTVAGSLGSSNWVVEPVAGWKMAWPTSLAGGATATFYMRDAVESFGSPTIPASGDYYIGWFYSVSQDMGTNGGSYYVDATSGGKIYYYSSEGDLSNPHQRIPRQGDSWDSINSGEKIHFRFETLPKADLTGTVFASPLLVDPVIEGTPLIDGLPMAGGQLVKDVQWATNVSSVEFQNADFVNCNYLVTYSINGAGTGSNNSTGWYQTRLQFCDHDGIYKNGTSDYISHCEWIESDDSGPPTINSTFAGLQRSIWLTGNGATYDHEGYVWIIPSNFRHNRNSTISQRWTQGTESTSDTHPRIFVRGHSFLSTGSAGQHYREEGGGTYRGSDGIFTLSGFRLFGSDSSNFGVPSSIGSSNGYVRIWRFKSGFEAREVS